MEHQHEHQHCDYNYDPHCCCEHVICLTSMFVHCGATVCASVATTGYLSNTHLCHDRCQLCQLSFFSFLPAFLWMHRLHRPLRLPKDMEHDPWDCLGVAVVHYQPQPRWGYHQGDSLSPSCVSLAASTDLQTSSCANDLKIFGANLTQPAATVNFRPSLESLLTNSEP